MELETSTLDNGVTLIKLSGRLDITGFNEIENKMTFAASSKKDAVVVDLTDVSFIASIGLRLLMANAKSQQQRGGKLVIYNPTGGVAEVLEMAGIGDLIPVHDDLDKASADALAAL